MLPQENQPYAITVIPIGEFIDDGIVAPGLTSRRLEEEPTFIVRMAVETLLDNLGILEHVKKHKDAADSLAAAHRYDTDFERLLDEWACEVYLEDTRFERATRATFKQFRRDFPNIPGFRQQFRALMEHILNLDTDSDLLFFKIIDDLLYIAYPAPSIDEVSDARQTQQ